MSWHNKYFYKSPYHATEGVLHPNRGTNPERGRYDSEGKEVDVGNQNFGENWREYHNDH